MPGQSGIRSAPPKVQVPPLSHLSFCAIHILLQIVLAFSVDILPRSGSGGYSFCSILGLCYFALLLQLQRFRIVAWPSVALLPRCWLCSLIWLIFVLCLIFCPDYLLVPNSIGSLVLNSPNPLLSLEFCSFGYSGCWYLGP